jgi:predicted acetyltransferase
VALPPHVLGHAGYTIVPWQRRRGHASAALRALLPHVQAIGLPYIEVTTDPDNLPSQRVIERAGGVLVERFVPPPAFGASELLRYRVEVTAS